VVGGSRATRARASSREMKSALTRLVPVLFLCGALWAADPFVGKWKLNVERSDFGDVPKALSGSARYKAYGGGYQNDSEIVFGKGVVGKLSLPVEFDGTAREGALDDRKIVFVSKRIDQNSYKVLIADRQTEKVTEVLQYTVSSDGKILTFTWIKGSQDKPVLHWVLVYDKE